MADLEGLSRDALKGRVELLQRALTECADRLERCCRTAGNDAETAAAAVWKYRKLTNGKQPE